MLVCLSVLKYGSWVYEKFYSNKKHIGGSSSGKNNENISSNDSDNAIVIDETEESLYYVVDFLKQISVTL